jgi:hypothetical protein
MIFIPRKSRKNSERKVTEKDNTKHSGQYRAKLKTNLSSLSTIACARAFEVMCFKHRHANTHTHHTHIYKLALTHTHKQTHLNMYTCTHIQTHTYKHTHTNTHIQTQEHAITCIPRYMPIHTCTNIYLMRTYSIKYLCVRKLNNGAKNVFNSLLN